MDMLRALGDSKVLIVTAVVIKINEQQSSDEAINVAICWN